MSKIVEELSEFKKDYVSHHSENDVLSIGYAFKCDGIWVSNNTRVVNVRLKHKKTNYLHTIEVPIEKVPCVVKAVTELETLVRASDARTHLEKRLNCLSSKELCQVFEIDMKTFILNGLNEKQIQTIKETFA